MKHLVLLILSVLCICTTYAQKTASSGFDTIIHSTHSSGFCKIPTFEYLVVPHLAYTVITLEPSFVTPAQEIHNEKNALLKVHGNVMYEYYNQGYVDTPYTGKQYYQHTIQVGMDIVYRNKYPFAFSLSRTINNSPFIKDWTSLNLNLDVEAFKRNVRQQVVTALEKKIKEDSLNIYRNLINEKLGQLASLQNRGFNKQARLQRMVEWKEKELYGKLILNDSLLKVKDSLGLLKRDSLQLSLATMDTMQQKIDSLKADLEKWQRRYNKIKKASDNLHNDLNDYLNGNYDLSEIGSLLDQYKISDTILPKGYQNILCVKTLAIGKTVLNYSELSAKNLLITGAAVELNRHSYIALSGGMIDYRFRNYFMPMNTNHSQYAMFARFGKKISEKSEAIITYYQGRKQLYNYSASTQNSEASNFNLLGASLLVNHHFSANHFVGLEIAKSSVPFYATDKAGEKPINTLVQSQHNTAYAFSFTSKFPSIHGNLSGFAKYYGINFQSFSLLNNSSNQVAYQVKWDHSLFHNDLNWGLSVQKNSFSNPYVDYTYSSSTVFKSIYARYHHGKLPSLFVSFSPSSQIAKLSDNHYQENVFNSLNASITHQYKVGGNHATTSLLFSRFYNRTTDSGFVYFNTKNWIVSNSYQVGKWMEQLNVNYSINTSYSLWVVENVLQWQCRHWLNLEAGCKWNKQTVYGEELWGYRGGLRINLLKLGELQGMFDRSYLPGMEKKLVKNNMGRITFTKTF